MAKSIHIHLGGKTKDSGRKDANSVLSVLSEMKPGTLNLEQQLKSGNISQSAKSIASTLEMSAKTVSQGIASILSFKCLY